MLAKKYRLTKEKDFKNIFKGGNKVFGRFFALRFLNNNLKYSRLAVVASLKVSKSAVVRNRLQRQAREIVKSVFNELTGNYDVAVNILPQAVGQKYSNLEKDLIGILKKVKVI